MASIRHPEPETFLPLAPAKYYILVALADGDRHGYAILREVRDLSGGGVRVSASTLYSLLQRLESDGLIREADERPDPALDDARRRYYRLTTLGREVAMAESSRLETVLATARSRRLGRAPAK